MSLFIIQSEKKQRAQPKFYFFDTGVIRALNRRLSEPLKESTYEYRELFEQFLFCEMLRLNSYKKLDYRFSYIRTSSDVEIDFVIERPGKPLALVEVKSGTQMMTNDAINLNRFSSDFKNAEFFCYLETILQNSLIKLKLFIGRKGLKRWDFIKCYETQ